MTTDQGSEFVDVPADEPLLHPSLNLDRDPVGDPTHPHWEGHTHDWPKRAKGGVLTCRDCGATERPETFEEATRG